MREVIDTSREQLRDALRQAVEQTDPQFHRILLEFALKVQQIVEQDTTEQLLWLANAYVQSSCHLAAHGSCPLPELAALMRIAKEHKPEITEEEVRARLRRMRLQING